MKFEPWTRERWKLLYTFFDDYVVEQVFSSGSSCERQTMILAFKFYAASIKRTNPTDDGFSLKCSL